MSLTRKLLKELELNEEAIERIIAAHADTVDALRTERDAALAAVSAREDAAAERDALRQAAANHLQEAERLRNEYDDYRRQVEGERTAAMREAVLRSALSRAGANEQAIPLLAKAVVTAEEDWENDALRDEAAALAAVRETYAAFFAQPQPLPTDPFSPPLEGGRLTCEEIRRMSAEEINRNWTQVQDALTQRR